MGPASLMSHYSSTDLELTIRLSVPVHSDDDGSAVVPARLVADIAIFAGDRRGIIYVQGEKVGPFSCLGGPLAYSQSFTLSGTLTHAGTGKPLPQAGRTGRPESDMGKPRGSEAGHQRDERRTPTLRSGQTIESTLLGLYHHHSQQLSWLSVTATLVVVGRGAETGSVPPVTVPLPRVA